MTDTVKGKRILLIGQVFYDYHVRIMAELEKLGAEVVFYDNKLFPEDPILYRNSTASKLKRLLNPGYKRDYHAEIIKGTEGQHFDVLFCIGGFAVSLELINTIKSRNPGIRSVIYFWDSFAVWPFAYLVSAFDKAYSFERADCLHYNMEYLPLFFSKEQIPALVPLARRALDLLYVGSVGPASHNRFGILAWFAKACADQKLNSKLLLLYSRPKHSAVIKALNAIRRFFDKSYSGFMKDLTHYRENFDFVIDKPLSTAELSSLFQTAKCVLDIQVPGQTGLTMRTIEALAQGCKLLTTNNAIMKEPFYDPEWVQVIDPRNMHVDRSFLSGIPGKPICIDYLSLDNWVLNIVGHRG